MLNYCRNVFFIVGTMLTVTRNRCLYEYDGGCVEEKVVVQIFHVVVLWNFRYRIDRSLICITSFQEENVMKCMSMSTKLWRQVTDNGNERKVTTRFTIFLFRESPPKPNDRDVVIVETALVAKELSDTA